MSDQPTVCTNAYDGRLESGEICGHVGPADLARFRRVSRYVVPGAESLMDVGCSKAAWLDYAARTRKLTRTLGVEFSSVRVEEARRRYPQLRIEQGSAEALDAVGIEPNSFDVVSCLEVLEHVPDWEKAFHSFFRYAARQVLVSVPYRENIIQTPCLHCGKLTPVYGHLRVYTKESFPQVPGWKRSLSLLPPTGGSLLSRTIWFLRRWHPWMLVSYTKR